MPANSPELASQIGTFGEVSSAAIFRFLVEEMLKIGGRTIIQTDLKALEAELHSAE